MTELNETEAERTRRACERVFLQIAHLTDHGPHSAIPELFTQDAEMDRDGTLVFGRAALQELYGKRPANLFTRHLVANLLVTPTAEGGAVCQATAAVYRHRGADAGPTPLPVTCSGPEAIVEYEDHLVRTDEGWKVSRRIMKTVIQTR